jgi:hypothetical protein
MLGEEFQGEGKVGRFGVVVRHSCFGVDVVTTTKATDDLPRNLPLEKANPERGIGYAERARSARITERTVHPPGA